MCCALCAFSVWVWGKESVLLKCIIFLHFLSDFHHTDLDIRHVYIHTRIRLCTSSYLPFSSSSGYMNETIIKNYQVDQVHMYIAIVHSYICTYIRM